jgi:glycosyltransferase involved in cell wall biosynthesis
MMATTPDLALYPAGWRDVSEDARRPIVGAGERIVLYSSSERWRGAGVSYINITRGLERHGFRPSIVCMPEVSAEFQRAGLSVHEVPRARGEAWRRRGALQRLGADAVLVDRVHDLRVATLATGGTSIALLSRYNHFSPKAPTDFLVQLAYRGPLREVVYLSHTAYGRVLRETPFMRRVRPAIIHEGVDLREFRPSRRAAIVFRREHDLGPQPFLLAVGALSPEKRYDLLFDAMHRLGPSAPLLVVCGDGLPAEEQCRRQHAASLGIRVRFLGHLPRPQLLGAYNACLGVVHAGACETFGLAVLEAMACGRPVVASAGGALPEVIGDHGECGMLVAGDRPDDFARALRSLVDDPQSASRMGVCGRERAASRFSLDLMEDQYAALVARHTQIQS